MILAKKIIENLRFARSAQRLLAIAAWLALAQANAAVLAQGIVIPPAGDAGALQQRQIREDRRRREQELLRPVAPDPLLRPEAAGAEPSPLSTSSVRFEVREIRFTHSAILSPAELEAMAVQYRGRQVRLAELQELVEKINELYKAKGVVTAIATIPPQDILDGVVQIRLVEGRIGEVNISDNATTRESYIKTRLGLVAGEIVDLNKIEDSLVLFNRTNNSRLEAAMQPGKDFGNTDIFINAVEPQQHQILATLDNLGSSLTGRWRAGTFYRNRSLLGFRDELALAYTYARGQDSWSMGYGFPVNRWGGRVNYTYYNDATMIRYGALSSLNITGRSYANVLAVRQPVYVKNNLQFDLTGGVEQRKSSNYLDDISLQGVYTLESNIGIDLQGSDDKSMWGVSLSHTRGDSDNSGVRFPYKENKGSAFYQRDVFTGWSLRSNLMWQYSKDKNLVSSEQFYIGGESSVRGYDAGAYAGDRGYSVNVELHHSIGMFNLAGRDFTANGFLFVDYGKVALINSQRHHAHLAGLGYGVNASLGKQTNLRMTLAHGLNALPQGAPKNMVFTLQLVHSL